MLSPFSVDLLDLATYNTNFPLLHYTGDIGLVGEDLIKIVGGRRGPWPVPHLVFISP